MFRTPFLIALSLAIAFGLGVPSVWWALDRTSALATLSIAEWSAEPFEGTSQADPYSRPARRGKPGCRSAMPRASPSSPTATGMEQRCGGTATT